MDGVIVIDASRTTCENNGAAGDALDTFQNNTIPFLGYYDDFGRLEVVGWS